MTTCRLPLKFTSNNEQYSIGYKSTAINKTNYCNHFFILHRFRTQAYRTCCIQKVLDNWNVPHADLTFNCSYAV